jgi:uncharacterized protein YbbC (DUF1343 family)
MVENKFRSFVSLWAVPYVYGLTCGELARMINGEGWIRKPCRLTVVGMEGWYRTTTWRVTGLPWVATSPNIPVVDSVFGYPALGLLGEMAGGSGLSIGGAVGRPFQCVTATWLDEDRLARELAKARLPGLAFRPVDVRREGRLHRCLELVVKDPVRAPLVAVNLHILEGVRKVSGRNPLREAETAGRNLSMLDKAAGSDSLRRRLGAGVPAAEITRGWKAGEEAFRRRRRPYLLYSDAPGPVGVSAGRGTSGEGRGVESGKRWSRIIEITVSKGDTMYGIARDFGLSITDLVEANPGMDIERLKIGQKLRVPRP